MLDLTHITPGLVGKADLVVNTAAVFRLTLFLVRIISTHV